MTEEFYLRDLLKMPKRMKDELLAIFAFFLTLLFLGILLGTAIIAEKPALTSRPAQGLLLAQFSQTSFRH